MISSASSGFPKNSARGGMPKGGLPESLEAAIEAIDSAVREEPDRPEADQLKAVADALGLRYLTGSANLAVSRWVAGMKRIFIGIAAALAVISTVCAQVPSPGTPQPQWPPATYPDPYSYRFVAPTPEDAYRQGLINRWQLEQLEGPTPQALQGPSPNGSRGGRGGGS